MAQESLEIYSHPNFVENEKLFQENYNLVDLVLVGDLRFAKRKLKGYSSRTCRFCDRSYPDAPFSSYSHLLPQLIGNSNMYSDFECDECNAYFSSLENDLAAYLGVSRSIVGLQGQKKTPGFAARRLRAKSRSFIGDNILIIAPEDLKRNGNTTSFTYTKNPYKPANVYKALLKSGLSLLEDGVIKERYKCALAYLMGKISLETGAIIGGYRLPFSINMPLHVYCFRSKKRNGKVPEHVMCFYFQNHILSLPLPDDLRGPDCVGTMPPPYFADRAMLTNSMLVPFFVDMSETM